MKIATAEQVRTIDSDAQTRFGIPAASLMETAGLNAWRALERYLGVSPIATINRSIAVVAGKGNNGGDALVIARCAHQSGWRVEVILAAPEDSFGELPAAHLQTVREMRIKTVQWPEEAEAIRSVTENVEVVIDGIAGSGIKGALRPPLDELVELITVGGALRVSIDVPSGLGDSWQPDYPVVGADVTLSMGLPQKSLYQPSARRACGTIVHVDVGFPEALTSSPTIRGELISWDTGSTIRQSVCAVSRGAYKHSRGVVHVDAGAEGTLGAAMLCAAAAQRSRAGLVHLVVDDELYSIAASSGGPVMVHPRTNWERSKFRCDSVLVGSGWGTGAGRAILLARLISRYDRGVLDADALNLLSRQQPTPLGEHWVMTPHVGELARLIGVSTDNVRTRFVDSALDCADRWGCAVVAKSQILVIAHPDGRFSVVDGMNPALGTGGTGDVLAGIIAGLLSGGADCYEVCRAAVLIHQQAGREARRSHGLFASDALLSYVARLVDHGE